MVPFFSITDVLSAEKLHFNGNDLPLIPITPGKDTGLDNIYVLNNLNDVTISFDALSNNVKWTKYSNLGGGFAVELSDLSIDGNTYTLSSPEGNIGYIIYDDDQMYSFWLVDYSKYTYHIDEIIFSSEQECDLSELYIKGNALPIQYYTINGKQEILDRDIILEYNSLKWDATKSQFIDDSIVKSFSYINEKITISPPPYCNTFFTISGDRFLKTWNRYQQIESNLYVTNAVNVMTIAQQESDNSDEGSNQISTDIDGLGGSAPCQIRFTAYVTDAVIHDEWQMATDEEFENITYRINDQEFTYTFTEEGITYIRYIGSNSDGSCETIGDVYKVTIGASDLLIPNSFSPNDDGVNDIWKVSYRSLLNFECWIFDRQGHQLYHFTNPDDGWDGKHKGKIVNSGVYFYIIQATGSDGKKYKKSGDINLINFSGGKSNSSSPEE